MIGWENNQGAYFIQKLQDSIDGVSTTIGKLSDLTTSVKTSIVAAINAVSATVGNLSDLSTSVKTSIVAGINDLLAKTIKTGLDGLDTTTKTSLLEAINEVYGLAKNEEVSSPVTMAEGFSATVMKAYQQGKIVIMDYQFSVASLTANTSTKIGTIKEAIKPKVEQYFTAVIGTYAAVGSLCKFILMNDGSIMLSVPSNVGETAQAIRGVFIYESV